MSGKSSITPEVIPAGRTPTKGLGFELGMDRDAVKRRLSLPNQLHFAGDEAVAGGKYADLSYSDLRQKTIDAMHDNPGYTPMDAIDLWREMEARGATNRDYNNMMREAGHPEFATKPENQIGNDIDVSP